MTKRTIYRSSRTGRLITEDAAKADPDRSETQHVDIPDVIFQPPPAGSNNPDAESAA